MSNSNLLKRSKDPSDYYTMWSLGLLGAGKLALLVYLALVVVARTRGENHLFQNVRAGARGFLAFVAANTVAVLAASSHMDTDFKHRLRHKDENLPVRCKTVEKIMKTHFRYHTAPVLLAFVILLTLQATKKCENEDVKRVALKTAFVSLVAFVMAYLLTPVKCCRENKMVILWEKIKSVYLEPRLGSLLLFATVLVAATASGTL